MEYHIEFVPSVRLMTEIGLRQWLRRSWMGYLLWLGLPLMTLCMCLASPEMTASRRGAFCTGAFLGAVLMIVIQTFAQLSQFCKAVNIAYLQQRQAISVTFDEAAVTYKYKGMSASYPWENFTKVWRQPHGWLLFYSEGDYLVLPTASLDNELQQFIVRKITGARDKVTK